MTDASGSPSRRGLIAGLAAAASFPVAPRCGAQAGAEAAARRLVAAAEAQIGVTTVYDPAYRRLPFPGGDVPRDRGVCTDVVVRAYRHAFGIDLQALVHADMRANFPRYPRRWGLAGPDASIDHRRVPNLRVFLARQGAELPAPADPRGWEPGDIVTQELAAPGSPRPGLPHIGIVSDRLEPQSGRRLVVHNISAGARLEDILATFRVTGRYRWLPHAS